MAQEEVSGTGADVFPEEIVSASGGAWVDSPVDAIEQIGVSLGFSSDAANDVNSTKTETNSVSQSVIGLPANEKTGSFPLGIEISDGEVEIAKTVSQVTKPLAEDIQSQGKPVDQQFPAVAELRKAGAISEPKTAGLSGEKVTDVEAGLTDPELPMVSGDTGKRISPQPSMIGNTKESNTQEGTLSRVPVDAEVSKVMENPLRMRPEPDAREAMSGFDADSDEGAVTQANRIVQTAEILGEGDGNTESNNPTPRFYGGNHDAGNMTPDASGAESVTFNGNSSKAERFQAHLQGQSADAAPQKIESGSIHEMVEKAVWSVRNGQSEVRIALKPDHLGHVRMLIATEAQQVNVRIFTDAAMTKDLIESHMQQLKNELEHQGLRVEQLDVLVAGDEHPPGTDRHAREKTRQQMFRRPGHSNDPEEQTGDEHRETDDQPRRDSRSEGIDYFA